MSGGKLKELELPVPPINEQRRIVAKLEALQARSRRAREALDAVPPLLEKVRQSILAAAFRGDLTKDWRAKHKDVEPASELLKRILVERRRKWEEGELAKMNAKPAPTNDTWKQKYKEPAPIDASAFRQLPHGWCWTSIDELATVGTGATPRRGNDEYYVGGTIPWVTSGALNEDVVSTATELVTERAVRETNLCLYPAGSLLMAMYGEGRTRGKVAELGIAATTNQAIAAILLTETAEVLRPLVRYALWETYARIRDVSSGGVQPNLNLEKVRGLPVPLCPLEESAVLAGTVGRALEGCAQLRTRCATQAHAFSDLERATLAKAFRGELVQQDSNDEPADAMLTRLRDANGASAGSHAKPRAPQRVSRASK